MRKGQIWTKSDFGPTNSWKSCTLVENKRLHLEVHA
jgi:hypothetical protein